MNIEIRKLTPDIAEDYISFFDITPHNKKWDIKCYCAAWFSDDSEGRNFPSLRESALYFVKTEACRGIWLIITIKLSDGVMPTQNQNA